MKVFSVFWRHGMANNVCPKTYHCSIKWCIQIFFRPVGCHLPASLECFLGDRSTYMAFRHQLHAYQIAPILIMRIHSLGVLRFHLRRFFSVWSGYIFPGNGFLDPWVGIVVDTSFFLCSLVLAQTDLNPLCGQILTKPLNISFAIEIRLLCWKCV